MPQARNDIGTAFARAGFDVATASVDYSGELSLDQVIGGVYSALPVDRLPRPEFTARIRRALEPHRPYIEDVHVAIVLGTVG